MNRWLQNYTLHTSLSLWIFVAAGAACSSGGSAGNGSDGGAGDDASTTHPDGFVAATLGTGTTSTSCPLAAVMPWASIGTATGGKPSTTESNSSVTIACSVHASGHGFDVSLSAVPTGQGGSFTLTSPAGQGAVTVAGGQVDVNFGGTQAAGPYEQSNCTLSFTYQGGPVPDSPSVFPGRIWAHVSCPAAQDQGGTDTCDGEADFLFEGCSQ